MKILSAQNNFQYDVTNVRRVWKAINLTCFDNVLKKPLLSLHDDLDQLLGHDTYREIIGASVVLAGQTHIALQTGLGQRDFHLALVHEMVHQLLIEKFDMAYASNVGHGHEFMYYAEHVRRFPGLTLVGETLQMAKPVVVGGQKWLP